MRAVYFEATTDNRGRLKVPKKFKSWFNEPVTMRFDFEKEILHVNKDFDGDALDGRRRIALGVFENTLVEVCEIEGALQIKKKTGRC